MGSNARRWGWACIVLGVLLLFSPFVIAILAFLASGGDPYGRDENRLSPATWDLIIWSGPVVGLALVLLGFALRVWSD